MAKHNIIGKRGERAVVRYLLMRFYKIEALNYSSKFGEIDIIARRGDVLAFVEVKTRDEKSSFGTPADYVNYKKQNRIIKTAYSYINHNKGRYRYRFDVAEVLHKNAKKFKINYIKDAFILNEHNYHR